MKRKKRIESTNETLLFLEYLKRNYNSPNTIDAYLRDISDFIYYTNNKQVKDIRKNDIETYCEYIRSKYKQSTVYRKLTALKQYFGYLYLKNILVSNPYEKINRGKYTYRLVDDLLSECQVIKAIENKIEISGNKRSIIRNKVLIILLYYCGIKSNELLKIKSSDIDFENNTIEVIGNKDRKRIVYFPQKYKDILKAFFCITVFKGKCGFVQLELQRRHVQRIINQKFSFIKFRKKITPTILRHSFVFNCINKGYTLDKISRLIGHTTKEMTKYIYKSILENKVYGN